jgi:hypothetical protein
MARRRCENRPFGAGRIVDTRPRIDCVQRPRLVRLTMSRPLHLCLLRLILMLPAVSPALAGNLAAGRMQSSDCRPRDADSTCAKAVAGAPATLPPAAPDGVLYDGPLGGVPAQGWGNWGFDFVSDEFGTPSPVRQDEFINRSPVAVTIRLTFSFPTSIPCGMDCLPGMYFRVDAGQHRIYPPFVVDGGQVTMTSTFQPGRGYAWVIQPWLSSNPRLTVSVPKGSTATLQGVGMPPMPAIATEIPRVMSTCDCQNGTTAPCSDGSRFSNGLLGPWLEDQDNYARAGAVFCPFDH